jgi:hypothetical protein
MNISAWLTPQVLGPALLILAAGLYLFFNYALPRITGRANLPALHRVLAYRRLLKASGKALEIGTGMHISSGSGGLSGSPGAAGITGLAMLRRIVQTNARNDRPVQSTSGDGALAAMAQDAISQGYAQAGAGSQASPELAQVAGITPFSYTAGAMMAIHEQPFHANLLLGHFGPEATLIAEAAYRSGQDTIAGSDSLPAQAALTPTADETLVGEELFAGGAYLQAGSAHPASLQAQDVLRWAIILVIVTGVVISLLGVK